MLARLFAILSAVMLITACRGDRGEALFTLEYAPLTFALEPGLLPRTAWVVEFPSIPSNYDFFLQQSGHADTEVNAVGAGIGRLTSLDNVDFDFVSEISVRICDVGSPRCAEFDEVYYIDDLYGRRLSSINLQPGLRNLKSTLQKGRFKMELVFVFGDITPFRVDCRFDYSFVALQ